MAAVWLRDYRESGSKHALASLAFAGFRLCENASAGYYYTADPTLSAWHGTSVSPVA